MGGRVKDTNNTKRIAKALEKLNSLRVDVGVIAPGDGQELIKAASNEYGTSRGIPERSFIRSTFDKKQGEIEKTAEAATEAVVALKVEPKAALEIIGTNAAEWVVQTIDSNVSPANNPETVKRKGGKNKTLIDTGRLRQSISYKVVKK